MTTTRDEYDVVAYPSHPLTQTHPNVLFPIAALHGLEPAPPGKCRVLEIGGGDGTNLIPMALTYPESEFLGIDRATGAVEAGRKVVAQLGLKNIRLDCADLMDFDPSEHGRFDYAIAHGVYSWVPPVVRDRILAVYNQALAPHGVGYVSYNTYPGCHVRRMLWGMMRFHTRSVAEPVRRIEQARSLMKFLADGQKTQGVYGDLLREELKRVAFEKDEAVLYHDDLADVNDPVYFHEFAAHAAEHGLEYLAEADYHETQDRPFPSEIAAQLRDMGAADPLLREQYLDFLKCRRFRQTLLCRRGAPLRREPDVTRLPGFSVASALQPESRPLDIRGGAPMSFKSPKGGSIRLDLPIGKAALAHLAECHPAAVPFGELLDSALRAIAAAGVTPADAGDAAALADVLFALYSAGVADLYAEPFRCVRRAGARPIASPLVRSQIDAGTDKVATLRHTVMRIDHPLTRRLLLLLDGTRDREAILGELVVWARANPPAGAEPAAPEQLREMLAPQVDAGLAKAAELGLLIA